MFRKKLARQGLKAVRRRLAGRVRAAALTLERLEARDLLDASTLLIGTWNVDIADLRYRPAGFETVLAAMGSEDTYAYPQPPDILTVTEVRSNARTGSTNDTDYLTQLMNDAYGAGTYDHGTLNGASTGGGTEGVIYNTQTVALLEERAVGVASSSGAARQELRYLFRPLAAPDGSADFYVYVGHYKAGSTTTDKNRRNIEAQQVRADADALGGAPVLYTGDFNADSSNEPAEQTLLSAGNGQAFDPIGRLGQWYNNPAAVDIDTINSASLHDRSDLIWETAPVLSSGGGFGLQDMPWTYHTFGNDGSVPLNRGSDYFTNDVLADLPNRLDVLYALDHTTSDHLPVLQNYLVVPPSAPGAHGSRGEPADLFRAFSAPVAAPAQRADSVESNGLRQEDRPTLLPSGADVSATSVSDSSTHRTTPAYRAGTPHSETVQSTDPLGYGVEVGSLRPE